MSSNGEQPLSRRFAAAYAMSSVAAPDDTTEPVKNARKALRRMKTEFKKKEKDAKEVCEAATVVGIPQRAHLCMVVARVQHDHALLKKELKRIS